MNKSCPHHKLNFFSGDYYIICEDCNLQWAIIKPGQPEYSINENGEKIGCDPTACSPFHNDYMLPRVFLKERKI